MAPSYGPGGQFTQITKIQLFTNPAGVQQCLLKMHKYNNQWKPLGWLPSGEEVSDGVGDVAGHAHDNGPFTAQVFDHDGRQEHGGDDDGGVDNTQGRHPHPLLRIQTALHRQPQESVR